MRRKKRCRDDETDVGGGVVMGQALLMGQQGALCRVQGGTVARCHGCKEWKVAGMQEVEGDLLCRTSQEGLDTDVEQVGAILQWTTDDED